MWIRAVEISFKTALMMDSSKFAKNMLSLVIPYYYGINELSNHRVSTTGSYRERDSNDDEEEGGNGKVEN